MSNLPIFNVAGSGMSAQSVRLNTVASNLANADAVTGSAEDAYKAKLPVFRTEQAGAHPGLQGVSVTEIRDSQAEPLKRYEPDHPLADEQGYVYAPAIDPVTQMVDMISASRSYQANVEVFNTAKELAMATLSMGR